MDNQRSVVEFYENVEDQGEASSTLSQKGKKEKKKYSFSKRGMALLVCACVVLSGFCGFGGAFLANAIDGSNSPLGTGTNRPSSTATMAYNLETATGSDMTVQEIIAMNENAVVEIRTEQVATDIWMLQYVTQGAGSGIVISENGYIMTNNHVIDGANKITVRLKNGNEYEAKVVGADSDTDVAVIKIDAKGLTSVVYGDSDSLVAGDLAVAIGNPLGELGGTSTYGIISATNREMTIDGKKMTLLQTDASINPGNSGGGLFNHRGELIGVVVAKSTGSNVEGLGFAIPINTAKEVAQQLVDNGYVKGKPALGITFVDLTSVRSAIQQGVRNTGIYVASVDSANAKKSGIKEGDMIYYVGETQITSADDLLNAVSGYKIGDIADVVVVRDNKMVNLKIEISERNETGK